MADMTILESSSLTEYIQKALASAKEDPVLAFPQDPHGANNFHRYTVEELKQLAHQAAAYYVSHGLKPRQQGERPLVVGAFAPGDILWVATFLAVVQMGHTFLVLSSRLPDKSVSALLDKAQCDMLIHGRRPELDTTAPVVTIPICSLTEPREPATANPVQLECDPAVIDPERDMAWIPHSSGSTGIPKLFKLTHAHAMRELRMLRPIFHPSKNTWVASAVYNVLGLRVLALALIKLNALDYFDNDRVPFTTERLEAFLLEARPQLVFATPYALELISSTAAGTNILSSSDKVENFGAVLPQAVGDSLVQRGVRLASAYGMSEGGALLTSALRSREDYDWDYLMAISAVQAPYLSFRPIDLAQGGQVVQKDEQLYELVLTTGSPGVLESVKDANGEYPTGDLFLKHPTKAGRWKVMGRKDDQLKIYQDDRQMIINAFEYENSIKPGNEDIVEEAVVFGQGKARLGVLIFAANAVDEPEDAIRERVWETVEEKINSTMKAKIDKDMIRIIADGAELPRTTKLNLVRPRIYAQYASVIEDAYRMEGAKPQAQVNGTI